MLIMLVDPIGRRVHFIRAGHNPPLTITGSGTIILFDNGGGPPVGLFPRTRYHREISNVEPGSVLVVYTDGVSEAENVQGDQLGLDRLASLVASVRLRSAAQIHTAIRTDLESFVGDAPIHDDSTLIVLKFP